MASARSSDFVAHLRERFDAEDAPGAVRLLTYHSPRASNGRRYSSAARGARAALLPRAQVGTIAEERRLFYVGLTRARTHLFLTWDRNRKRSQVHRRARARRCLGRVESRAGRGEQRAARRREGGRGAEKAEPSLKPRLRDDSWRPF